MSKETSKKAYVAPKLEEHGTFAARTLQYPFKVTEEVGNPELDEIPMNL